MLKSDHIRVILSICSFHGCSGEPPMVGSEPPIGQPLNVVAHILVPDSFPVSGGVSNEKCEILLVGAVAGTIVRIREDGSVDHQVGRVPGGRATTRLELSDRGRIILWSNYPAFWGILNPDLTVDSLPLSPHPWGGFQAGPTAGLASGYVMAPLADNSSPRESPRPWRFAPLTYVLGPHGEKVDSIGTVEDRSGAYLSWFAARVVVGHHLDTLLVLNLSNGIVSAWGPPYHASAWSRPLPHYFDAPPPREVLRKYPWIQGGGGLRSLITLSQVETASIGEDGTIYAVRSYEAKWESAGPRHGKTEGRWQIVARGLESYTSHGDLITRYELPQPSEVRWLRVGAHGRILLRQGKEVLIADPLGGATGCPGLPDRIQLRSPNTP